MILDLYRLHATDEWTVGALYINKAFQCFTLEDQRQDGEKVPGETRIPAGRYDMDLRAEGSWHQRLAQRFPQVHRGALHITEVPGFQWILIHPGNTDDHTEGCILVGETFDLLSGFVGRSNDAYKALYQIVVEGFLDDHRVTIQIHNQEDWICG